MLLFTQSAVLAVIANTPIKGEVQSRVIIILKERVKISLQIGAKMMKIG